MERTVSKSWRLRGLGAMVVGLALLAGQAAPVPVHATTVESMRYVRSTGHTISGPFLQYLQVMGDDLLGAPISEPMPLDGTTVQWFERGRLDLTPRGGVALGPIGGMLATVDPAQLYSNGAPQAPTDAASQAIQAFYLDHGGEALFGPPIAPPQNNQQWFERARLDYSPDAQTVSLGDIGADAMQKFGLQSDQAQLRWVAAQDPVPFRSAPMLRAPNTTLDAGRAVVQTGTLDGGWVEVWDLISNQRGWVRDGQVAPADPPAWVSKLDGVTPDVTPARVISWNSGWKFNSQVRLVAHGTGDDGADWYVTQDGDLIPGSVLRVPPKPAKYLPGKWIDANLSVPVIVTAYEDDRPIYSALAVKGTTGNPTRIGTFSILRRVANETMDSTTLGVGPGQPGYYHLTGVLWTQYFTEDGASIHYNYWRANWGYPGSHGCLGMNLEDSKFFWDWDTIGTPVITHY